VVFAESITVAAGFREIARSGAGRGCDTASLRRAARIPALPTCLQESAVRIVCLDLEGVLVPEIWIEFAERTGIPELRRTTRDEPNYDTLMKYRLDILAQKKLGLPDIQDVIASMGPMQGAREFLDALRDTYQVVILSDTFYEFAKPLMKQLGLPTLFCHSLEADAEGILVNYHLRMPDQKREAVKRFKELNFKVVAAGDSYNDTAMLGEAHGGILFHPPENVVREFPQFPVVRDYDSLRAEIDKAFARV
jgi:phosphoserine/homoserine phosphotransferase